MKFLALEHETPGTLAEAFLPHLKDEAFRVWELYQQGVVREVYYRADRQDAVLVLECAGLPEANAALETLPLVKAGLVHFEVIPLKPYPGYGRLFREGAGGG